MNEGIKSSKLKRESNKVVKLIYKHCSRKQTNFNTIDIASHPASLFIVIIGSDVVCIVLTIVFKAENSIFSNIKAQCSHNRMFDAVPPQILMCEFTCVYKGCEFKLRIITKC